MLVQGILMKDVYDGCLKKKVRKNDIHFILCISCVISNNKQILFLKRKKEKRNIQHQIGRYMVVTGQEGDAKTFI